MPSPLTTIRHEGRSAVVHLHGDLVVTTARGLYATLRTVGKRRNVRSVVLDFARAGRIDSSGLAVLSLVSRQLKRSSKQLDFAHLQDQHRAALELLPTGAERAALPVEHVGAARLRVEGVGVHPHVQHDHGQGGKTAQTIECV